MKIDGKTLRRLIREAIRRNLTVLSEGGNVFSEVNSAVPKQLLEKNIENALKLAGLGDMEYEIVGNISRPLLGDIDIAVDEDQLREIINIDKTADMKQVWTKLNEYIKSRHEINSGLGQFHLLAPLIGADDKQKNAVDPEGVDLGIPGVIQIDVFVGNLGWMKNVLSGSPIDSKYKAVYRNILLTSILSNVPHKLTDAEIAKYSELYPGKEIKKRFFVNFHKGNITRLYYEDNVGKSGKPLKSPTKVALEEETMTNANDLARTFMNEGYAKSLTWNDMNSYEKLIKLLNSDEFKFPELRQKIISDFKSSLGKNPVPTGL